jgi:RNA polymerase sigma-70 factor, ECF subfamily
MAESMRDVTQLLRAWSEGDEKALNELTPLVHAELRRLARMYMAGERTGHTLETRALVNEAFMRLVEVRNVAWQDRVHFFAISARLMRRVLVDHARSRGFKKRGAAQVLNLLDEEKVAAPDRRAEFVSLDEALSQLEKIDRRKARVVEMRFFGGLTNEEIAGELSISPFTVLRDWNFAKAWLCEEIAKAATK